ncbi:hypothetical protein KGF56_000501 [Candida oxycetoniae]|uniref:Uncharacterized protein n=1 Tax=Candida oxycetoniae TaxID=497107 RepID=A0AAI9X077_9ASCO|nr:uncharacterized protein KGF56_000501 [Candida oxycetoniae]KAI3406655.1 hypothetical protein KGF56_000501 [Candida oxycetoniae]
MFFIILAVALVLAFLVLILPKFSGLTTIKRNTHSSGVKKRQDKETKFKSSDASSVYTYIPPDELENNIQKEANLKSKASALKEKLELHSEDLPIRIELNQFVDKDNHIRKRKVREVDLDMDPNKYDYDLDDLIAEENEMARQEQQREHYKNQKFGETKEEMV